MTPEYVDITPSSLAYTPSMDKFKSFLEELLTRAHDEEFTANDFRDFVVKSTLEIKGLMAMVLMQDILYKAGVEYRPNRITGE